MGAARGLPEGTVTFLFTDVERSTQQAAELGDQAWADALEAHRAILRPAFEAHGGVEVGTEGDSFFVAFARAADAVTAAIAGQRALAGRSTLRVRMGMHTGEALVRDGDYIGHDVHKAKRVSDAGHGGQILLSQTTADLVAARADLIDLGHHRLKDLGEPQHLFQVTGDGLETEFRALRTLDVARNNLPVQLTSFVGRKRELEHVAAMLSTHRLVTLTGVGGCGKTRLAIHAAAAAADSAPDGVYFCDLSRIADEASLVPTVACALGLDESTRGALTRHLGHRRLLLVVDNCEHVVDAVAELVEDLLQSSPNLRVLATSREALEVEGEQAWSVPSLDAGGEAAQLFAERAASVRGSFTLDESNLADVHAICVRLDGIPLAIELAAAQVGHLGVRQIAERLDDRFATLTGGRRRVQRQQTLQATMDWSWELLEEHDRALLRRLAVFQGGCTLEAAEAVCGEGVDVVMGVRSLVSKSLVVAQEEKLVARYRLLETVRLFAEDQLARSGESDSIRDRHRDYYLAWSEALPLKGLYVTSSSRASLLRDVENVRAALRWSEMHGQSDLLVRVLLATRSLWITQHEEGRERLVAALANDLPPQLRGRLLAALAEHEMAIRGGPGALTYANEALALLGDEFSIWVLLASLARPQRLVVDGIRGGDPSLAEQGITEAKRCVALASRLDEDAEASASVLLGILLGTLTRHGEAAEAFAAAFRVGGPSFRDNDAAFHGLVAAPLVLPSGVPPEIEAVRQREIDRQPETDPKLLTAFALVHAQRGDFTRARRTNAEWLNLVRETAPREWTRMSTVYAATIDTLEGRWERAAKLFAFASHVDVMTYASSAPLCRHFVPIIEEHLGPERAAQLKLEGREMTFEEGVALALEGSAS